MTREEFDKKWNGAIEDLVPMLKGEFASDLDSVIKDRAVEFAKKVLSIDPQHFDYQSEADYYDTYIKEQ